MIRSDTVIIWGLCVGWKRLTIHATPESFLVLLPKNLLSDIMRCLNVMSHDITISYYDITYRHLTIHVIWHHDITLWRHMTSRRHTTMSYYVTLRCHMMSHKHTIWRIGSLLEPLTALWHHCDITRHHDGMTWHHMTSRHHAMMSGWHNISCSGSTLKNQANRQKSCFLNLWPWHLTHDLPPSNVT